MKKSDDIGIGFIVGTFAGAFLIGGLILPQSEGTLAKTGAYLDIIVPFATALLAVSIAYIGNKIANGNAIRDKYRHNWEMLTAWREMYKWLSFEETKPIKFLEVEQKVIWRLSSYLALSEDPSQPPDIVKGSLLRFNLDDLSEILQDLKDSYSETTSKIQQLESNSTSLKNVTETFFNVELDWDLLIKEVKMVKSELHKLDFVLKRCNKLINGINKARDDSELNGENSYNSVIYHLREQKKLVPPLNFEEIVELKKTIKSISKRYTDLCSKMNSHYQSFCPEQ